ncbi:hypothetical protein [Streptomyces sp. GC420]|uniref:hypothetical protein n=1 Tax=Streptomyces sp. GC420 TaxID=2697568 RepID=UPI001AA12C0B|nr:hypothetical protein [Streptomyces sp. GC420]
MKPHAEIDQVWPRHGRVGLTGHLHGLSAAGSAWRLLLVRRSRPEHELRYPAGLDGERFECAFPVRDLAPFGCRNGEQWDIHLTTRRDGAEIRLRAGRRLDDIRGKKHIMVFPAQPADDADGAGGPLTVRPYYTVQDNLSLECTVPAAGSAPAGAGAGAAAGRAV